MKPWSPGSSAPRCSTGGDFAEVFAEDKRLLVGAARRRPGRGALLGSRPWRRHPGGGGRHHRLRPHRRPDRGRPPGRRRGGGRRREGRRGRHPHRRPRPARRRTNPLGRRAPAGRRAPRPARSSCCAGPTRPAAARHGSVTQVSARYGDSRRRILVANSDGLLAEDEQVRTLFTVGVVASGDTGMQTGRRSIGHTIGFELFDRYDVAELAQRGGRPRPSPSCRPGPPRAARCRW